MSEDTIPAEDVIVRYIAGITVAENQPMYYVFAVGEDAEGNRVLGPQTLTQPMTKEQAEHLHLQLGNALGFNAPPPPPPSPERVRDLLMREPDLSALEAEARIREQGPETPVQIATRIASQRSVGGFNGLSDNTRKIIYGAALQAAKAASGWLCPECGRVEGHSFGCSVQTTEAWR